MATVQFSKDKREEGEIRVNYSTSQDVSNNRTLVEITSIQFRSYQEAMGWDTRTYNWTATGIVRFSYNGTSRDISYYSDSFNAHNQGWVNLGGRSESLSFYVNHNSAGNGSFSVSLQPYGSYNDFNVFYPYNQPYYNCEYSGGTSLTAALPQIDNSGPTITLTASVDTQNNVLLSATSNVACSGWKYQVDSGFTWTSMDTSTNTTANATIPNMSGAHTFVVRATKVSNGVTGSSNAVSTDTPGVSWDSNVATTDGSITLTATNLPAFTAVQVKYGSTGIESNTWGEDKQSQSIIYSAASLKQWFTTAGVTTLQSITITASIDGYPSATASFTLTAGNNMKPLVLQPTPSIVQPERIQQTFPNTWIANVSKAKVSVPAEAGSNAAISSVTVSYGSETMTLAYDSTSGRYEGTTSKPITGNTVFTATVTDQRGMTAQSSYSLTGVQAYTKPTVTIDRNRTYRCDSSGANQDGGPYVRVQATMAYDTGIQGNTREKFYFYVSEDGSETTHDLSSGVQSAAFALLSPRPNNAITIVVVAQDKISDEVTARITLGGSHKDVVVARINSKTCVGIGTSPVGINSNRQRLRALDNINLSASGVYAIDGRDVATFSRAKYGTSALGYNILAVDTYDHSAAVNQTAEIYISAANLQQWSNFPAAIDGTSNFVGIRRVTMSTTRILVTMFEMMPVLGRIWINWGRILAGEDAEYLTVEWNGWKGHTPDIT